MKIHITNKLLILIVSILFLIGCHKTKESFTMNKAHIVEVVVYQTKPGVNDAEHIKKALAISPVLAQFPGFVSRQFTKTTDGKWIDIVYWTDLSLAKKAAQDAQAIPICQVFFADMDMKTMQFMYSEILSRYP